jgi:hypothetical protein
MKSINDLKAIVVDGSKLWSKSGQEIVIQRFPNNIIKIHNKPISWKNFHELLICGEYELIIKETNLDLFSDKEKKEKRGGARVPGPGKTLGRNKIKPGEKKRPRSIALTDDSELKLRWISKYYGVSKSEFITNLIKEEWETTSTLIINSWDHDKMNADYEKICKEKGWESVDLKKS